jgi:uncharacterized membrane protein YkoI/predicted nucleic acid-binding Zn ribbon protein
MKCSNCGQENDADDKFCKKCGSNLNKSGVPEKSGMPDTTKILIVIVIFLVAVLGLVSGMMLMKNQVNPISNNTTKTVNNTTNSSAQNNQPNTSNQDNSSNSNNNYISESQAISIAESAWPVSGATYYISRYPTSDSPNYWVAVHNGNYTGPGGFVEINAVNGEVISKGK